MPAPLILASASPRRLALLAQIGVVPAQVISADIDESAHKGERPNLYAARVAREKALAVAANHSDAIVLAADTVVACGRRILPKAEDEKTTRACLALLSGKRHRVYTAVCISAGGKLREKTVMTQVKFHRLTHAQIEAYIATQEWQGKAGGYAIQGSSARFIPSINGSFSNVVGLPLAEVATMLSMFNLEGSNGSPR